MKIQKYFGFVSYNGKMFSGSQNQNSELYETVQGTIKSSFDKVFHKNLSEFSVRLASRTDAGVHAYKNGIDFFLNYDEADLIYPPIIIKRALNSHLLKNDKNNLQNIYFNQLYLAENDFDSRKDALLRKYIYKIILKPQNTQNLEENDFIFKNNNYYYINSQSPHKNLKTEKIEEISKLFENNFYDYSNFYKNKNEPWIKSIRKINKIEVKILQDEIHHNTQKIYLIFEAKSFLRNQIRLIVNTILDYASDKLTKEEVLDYLLIKKVNKNKCPAPPEGLYLSDIIYNEEKYSYHNRLNESLELEYFKYKKF